MKKATKLDSCKDFYVDGICLGEQVPDINTDWYVSKKENVCNKLEFQRLEKDGRMLNSLLSCLMGKNADYRHLSYNNIYSHLVSLEFKVIKDPCVEYDSSWHCYRLRAVLKKETKEFVCSIEFYGGDKGNSTNIDIAKNDKGTLKSICVELVNANSTPTENISTSQETYNDYSDRDDGGYYNNDDGLEPILGAGEIGFLW